MAEPSDVEQPAPSPASVRGSSSPSVVEVRRCRVSVAAQPGKTLSPSNLLPVALVLSETDLSCEVNGTRRALLLEDLIGVQILPRAPPRLPNACHMEVHHYPLSRSGFSRKLSRKFALFEVAFDSGESFKDNLTEAIEWKKAICMQCNRVDRQVFDHADRRTCRVLGEEEAVLVPRHFLVLINPMGGKGNGVSDFIQHVQPMFDMAEINYNVIVTERQNHAKEIIKDYNVSGIDGIVISSGDGLLYEVINGIMERPDWEEAIRTPIGMLPTGSGNALCAATLYESDEEFSLTNAAFQIVRGGIVPMDLATVHTGTGEASYMALLSNWGLVADVDIESEKLRRIGDSRFTLGALYCIVKKRAYRGRLHYLPCDEDETVSGEERGQEEMEREEGNSSLETRGESTAQVEVEDPHPREVKVDMTPPSSPPKKDPKEPITIDVEPLATLPNDDTPQEAMIVRTQIDASADVTASPETTDDIQTENGSGSQSNPPSNTPPDHTPGPPLLHLPPSLSEPLPPAWKTIEGEFLAVGLHIISHMSRSIIADPNLHLGSGTMRLQYSLSDMTRRELLTMFTEAETGAHLEMERVHSMCVKACRLEPLTTPGMLTADGEVLEYGPVQYEVHRHLARVMCRRRKS